MRIALCSKGDFSLEKGYTKNRIELSDSLQRLEWETLLVDRQVLGISVDEKLNDNRFSTVLKEYLVSKSSEFDVVLYEYDSLPFPRGLFCESTLFVARPAILAFHHEIIKFPINTKTRLSQFMRNNLFRFFGGGKDWKAYFRKIEFCLAQADLIQVQNKKDYDLLVRKGFPDQKIVVIGNGITSERISEFDQPSSKQGGPFVIGFVGTFDFRKGAMDFPFILERLKRHYPDLELKLMGTKGLFTSEKEVLNFFPKKFHTDIQVIPFFKSKSLPQLLKDCHLGVFPSYLESFGFGALEMMCAGLPVVAYDAPGPADFILPELLVPTGDKAGMVEKILSLLKEDGALSRKGSQARKKVIENYRWDDLAILANRNYRRHLHRIRTGSVVEEIS
jgi:glycosyltransferase involved in cell wall biosynthesis